MTQKLMMTVEEFAEAHGISDSTVRRCIRGDSDTYPPLMAKRVGKTKTRIYITAEQAAAWRDALDDA